MDIIHNYIQVQKSVKDRSNDGFKMAKLLTTNKGMFYIDSNGDNFSIKDPKVKLIVPSMGDFANRLIVEVFKKRGIRTEGMPIPDIEVLRHGRSVTTCKECLPMILCVGAMLNYLEKRKNSAEKLIVFQPRAAGYCRLGQYHVYMKILIKERKLKDIALMSLANEERYSGLGPTFALAAWEAIVISDILDDIRNTIMAIADDPKEGIKLLYEETDKICNVIGGRTKKSLYKQLKESALRMKENIKTKIPLHEAPHVMVMGEIYVRRDSFSNQNIAQRLAEHGFVTRISHVGEWIYYLNYMIKNGLHISDHTLLGQLEFFISDKTQQFVDNRIKKIMSLSGLYEQEKIDIADIVRYSQHLLPNKLKGEPGLIIGVMMRDSFSKYAGIINIGPFGCMPVRFTEALISNNADMNTKQEAYKNAQDNYDMGDFSTKERIPFLTIEADGNPYPQLLEARFESFCLQARRIGEKQGKKVLVF